MDIVVSVFCYVRANLPRAYKIATRHFGSSDRDNYLAMRAESLDFAREALFILNRFVLTPLSIKL